MTIQYSQYFDTYIGENLKALLNGQFDKLNDDEILELLEVEGTLLQFIGNPTMSERFAAIQSDSDAILLVKQPSWEEKLMAVRKKPSILREMKNPPVALQIEAVKHDPTVIEHILAPKPKVQFEAVRLDGMVLRHFAESATRKVRMAAVMQNGESIAFISNPSESEVLAALRRTRWAAYGIRRKIKMSLRNQLEAVRLNPFVIGNIENQSDESRMEALRRDCQSANDMLPLNWYEQLAYCVGWACKFGENKIHSVMLPDSLKNDLAAHARLQSMIDDRSKQGASSGEIIDVCLYIME